MNPLPTLANPTLANPTLALVATQFSPSQTPPSPPQQPSATCSTSTTNTTNTNGPTPHRAVSVCYISMFLYDKLLLLSAPLCLSRLWSSPAEHHSNILNSAMFDPNVLRVYIFVFCHSYLMPSLHRLLLSFNKAIVCVVCVVYGRLRAPPFRRVTTRCHPRLPESPSTGPNPGFVVTAPRNCIRLPLISCVSPIPRNTCWPMVRGRPAVNTTAPRTKKNAMSHSTITAISGKRFSSGVAWWWPNPDPDPTPTSRSPYFASWHLCACRVIVSLIKSN